GEICKQILPPGVVNIVTGGRETGEALVRHPRVKRIAFIGQPPSGMAIQKAAAETAVKYVTLELGGKNPLMAFADADPEKVAASSVGGMNFGWQGQSCGSMSRILLHESICDDVTQRILERVRKIKVGHPLDAQTNMGPVNNKAQYRKVLSYIDLGRTEGAAIEMANAIDLGLTAAVWTNDINRALRVAQAVQAGYVWVNGVGQHYRGVPYGGFKNSGVGREEGISELLSYTEEKVINI